VAATTTSEIPANSPAPPHKPSQPSPETFLEKQKRLKKEAQLMEEERKQLQQEHEQMEQRAESIRQRQSNLATEQAHTQSASNLAGHNPELLKNIGDTLAGCAPAQAVHEGNLNPPQ
jgi:predicted nuclease with TOPRIM domain